MTNPTYSHLFSCLFDQAAPVGNLGRGAHHSVFRAVQWHGPDGPYPTHGRVQDFAVIWDEDHDTRVIDLSERLHLAGLLWPVAFIGERKGVVTVLCATMAGPTQDLMENYVQKIRSIASDVNGDYWTCQIGQFQRAGVLNEATPDDVLGIISDDSWRVGAYLRGIDALWELGPKSSSDGA